MISAKTRIERLQRRLAAEKLDAVLVTQPVNVSYLTGFTGDSSFLLVSKKRAVLISDTRFATQIEEECPGLETEIRDAHSSTLAVAARVIGKSGGGSLGYEADSLTCAALEDLKGALPDSVTAVSTRGWVEDLRMVKDREEIALIRKSIQINERTFEVIRAQLYGEQTERQIAHNIEHQMRALGAEQCAFKPIVGVGPRSALPHANATERRIFEAPFALIDWGAQFQGYCSDLTRMVLYGKVPAKLEKIYRVVLAAQVAAIERIRPGVELKTVDAAARSTIEEAGFGKFFGHGTGHGFGRQIHEAPFISPIREGILKPGMVVTVEPGIYLPDFGGVRIEDDCLVTPDGVEVLSQLPKTLESARLRLV